jgi:hypothetical protein
VRCRIGHAAAATGLTNGAALARQRQQPIPAAGSAKESYKAAGQNAALEIPTQLALDKPREPISDQNTANSADTEHRQLAEGLCREDPEQAIEAMGPPLRLCYEQAMLRLADYFKTLD